MTYGLEDSPENERDENRWEGMEFSAPPSDLPSWALRAFEVMQPGGHAVTVRREERAVWESDPELDWYDPEYDLPGEDVAWVTFSLQGDNGLMTEYDGGDVAGFVCALKTMRPAAFTRLSLDMIASVMNSRNPGTCN